jgi:DNA-binding NarL/FixJ family response regulator
MQRSSLRASVLVADDHPVFREAVAEIVARHSALERVDPRTRGVARLAHPRLREAVLRAAERLPAPSLQDADSAEHAVKLIGQGGPDAALAEIVDRARASSLARSRKAAMRARSASPSWRCPRTMTEEAR